MEFTIIRTSQHDEWLAALRQTYRHDFYHCPSYHALSVRDSSQEAVLIVCTEGPYTIAIPLILRPTNEVEGLEEFPYLDATSVYGYVGPVASHEHVPSALITKFQSALCDFLKESNVVCAFSRLHPLLAQKQLLAGLGDIVYMGETVSIDLTLPADEQWSQYRRDHKSRINQLRRMGVSCIHNNSSEYMDEFIRIYNKNMDRVNADAAYYFGEKYFKGLLQADDLDVHLFSCIYEGEVVCSVVFGHCCDIIQAHLGGTKNKFTKYSPMRLIFDEARIWANATGDLSYHLGGGLGAKEDSIFDFKEGFSRGRHDFCVWRLIVDKRVYDMLCRKKVQWNRENKRGPTTKDFFPDYRCPASPALESFSQI